MYIEHCSVDLKNDMKILEDKKADSICIVKYNGNNDDEPVVCCLSIMGKEMLQNAREIGRQCNTIHKLCFKE